MKDKKKILVTGGTGFIGSALVRRLVQVGHTVSVLDNNLRGVPSRLDSVADKIELIKGDITKFDDVLKAVKDVDVVCHLAFLNGTEFFYSKPELVLEIAVKGITHILDACVKQKVKDFVLASSSEVYQTPSKVPTNETVAFSVPDPLNPRYSYGGGKIISELMAINYGRKYFDRTLIFRPHNVYGPDMGWEHVIPQLIMKLSALCANEKSANIQLPIQGTGKETRSFIYIDDFISGLMLTLEKSQGLEIYNIGTTEEISIESLATEIGSLFHKKIEVVPGRLAKGGTSRRCPDITKLKKIGFSPQITLSSGLQKTMDWYIQNRNKYPKGNLKNDNNVPRIYK